MRPGARAEDGRGHRVCRRLGVRVAGAKELRPVSNQFYGDRMGTLEDPFGHVWSIGTHVEDVSPEEMRRRSEEMMKQKA